MFHIFTKLRNNCTYPPVSMGITQLIIPLYRVMSRYRLKWYSEQHLPKWNVITNTDGNIQLSSCIENICVRAFYTLPAPNNYTFVQMAAKKFQRSSLPISKIKITFPFRQGLFIYLFIIYLFCFPEGLKLLLWQVTLRLSVPSKPRSISTSS